MLEKIIIYGCVIGFCVCMGIYLLCEAVIMFINIFRLGETVVRKFDK